MTRNIKPKNNILIIGAGPAGLACAMELSKKGYNFVIVEKDKQIGGLSKTYKFGDFKTDNGPHRFFSQNQYLYDFIGELLGEKWIKVDRLTRFYIKGKLYMYPIDWKNVMKNLGLVKMIRVIIDFVIVKVRYRDKTPKNFEEYALKNFGRTLADLNVINFNKKLWGLPLQELSVEWANQRVKDLTVSSLIKNTFLGKSGPKTLVDQFYYPSEGTGAIYEEIKKKILSDKGNQIITSDEPVEIKIKNNKISSVILKSGNEFNPDIVVSSVPIHKFLNILEPEVGKKIVGAANKLKYRSQVYLFITLNKRSITKDQWIYFPDEEIPFTRISEMKNFSSKMSPKGKTSLFVEFFCWEGDDIWNLSKSKLFELALPYFEKMKLFSRKDVINFYHIKAKDNYPVYDINYQKNLKVVKNYLDSIKNLHYIGRPGRFKYTNQDHSLEMGIITARSILENKKYDLDRIGSENKYFERGNIR